MGHLSRVSTGVPAEVVTAVTARTSATPASRDTHDSIPGSGAGTTADTAMEARGGTSQDRPSRPRPPVWSSVRTMRHSGVASETDSAAYPAGIMGGMAPRVSAYVLTISEARLFVETIEGWNSTDCHG